MLAHHCVDLSLETRAELDQLEAVTNHLPEFPDFGRGDPRLGQTAEAEKVDQVVGIALVVLDAPVPPVVPQGMGQVDPSPHLLEDIRRPIPPERRLQYHLWLWAGGGHRFRQRHWTVVDPDLGENLTSRVLPHDHRPAPVQVDPDILSFHRGLLLPS